MRWTAQSGYQIAPKTPSPNDAHLFGRIFGSPGGPQNRPKIDPWPQKGRQEAIFYRFFSRTAFVSLLGLIFHRFLMIFWSKNRCIFPKPRAIFSTWRWPKSMHRRSVLSTFYFFHFFEICEKMTQKNKQNRWSKKHRKIGPRGSQNWPKMAHNSSKIRQKSQKCQKNMKIEGLIFYHFFEWQKNRKPKAWLLLSNQFSWPLGSSGGL